MKKSKHPPQTKSDAPHNQGEGDVESARRYNEAQQDFVESPQGRAAIENAGDVEQDELEELEDAEAQGLARAKEEDPAVHREPNSSYQKSRGP